MAITSTGIGSGLDVEKIIGQLSALEKRPLTTLISKAADIQARMSVVGQIKSQVSALADSARKLALDSSWTGVTLNSSKSTAVTGSATSAASATTFSVEVQQLAKAQSVASSAVTVDTAMGTGTLNIQLGTWSNAVPPVFTPGAAGAVSVVIGAGEDKLTSIAAKINDANAGVTATVLRDASGERLLVRSKDTGEAAGFRIQVTNDSDVNNEDNSGLSRLAFDPATGILPAAAPPTFGMGANTYQKGLNTQATINGIAVTSSNSQLVDAVPGVTLQFLEETTGPVTITLEKDQAAVRKNIQDFVAAYNSLSKTLSDATKYDDQTKMAGTMQGDTVVVGLQNVLRNLLSSASAGSTFSRLADVGLEMQRGGMMAVSSSKLDTALKDVSNLKLLFTADNSNAQTNGFALKLKSFADGLLATGGSVTNKNDALQSALKRNSKDQAKINQRVATVENQLRRQYSALDAQMGNLTALNAYISQQVAQWNKTSG